MRELRLLTCTLVVLLKLGILYKDTLCLIGCGVVIDPKVILQEIDGLIARGIDCKNLRIDPRAHVIMPWHIALDGLSEKKRGNAEIGTTRRGIGPCYMDKAERCGIRMYDLVHPELFREKAMSVGILKNDLITKLYEEEPIDLDGKLKLEYYKLQKTFEGAIKLEKVDGQYIPSKKQGAQGIRQKSTLDEILDKINEKYKGQFTDGDRVMLGALHDKLIADDKLASSARTSDPRIFTESIFPSAFGNAAMESYMEAQDSYGSLFEDKSKYDAVMSALAGVIYREMRSKKTVDYRKIERDEQVQMVAEEPVKYGK